MPFAGKTGTTQNWSDAWTVGFSPYITTAVWLGFDMPGNSLGLNQTGAMAAGPVWSKFMRDIHMNNPDYPPVDFKRPTGLVDRSVCSVSGMLPTQFCTEGVRTEIFIAGTEARTFCNIHEFRATRDADLIRRLQNLSPGGGSIAPVSNDIPSIQTLRSINQSSTHTVNETIDRSLLD